MQIFAHRGFSLQYPENTMTAFRKALEAGADGIELDVRMTVDGKLVIMHDQTVDRTTNGKGKVRDLTFAEILSLDAGIKKGVVFENERIPVLEQVFDELGGKLLLNVELCNYEEGDNRMMSNQTVELIEKYKLVDSVIVSSFRFNNLVYVKDKNPNISCALLAKQGLLGAWARNILNHSVSVDALHPYYTDTNPGLIRREQQCGRKVRAWTVNDPKDIRNLSDMGVDAIFTDDPLNAREFYASEKLLDE
ncbi:MAG: glycerophosphodiester phosphodiesterase [Anaerolineaceae bacterium]|nr:glycerophosphodiester phosphodiesterase [Anaerolineaceae bacterium]